MENHEAEAEKVAADRGATTENQAEDHVPTTASSESAKETLHRSSDEETVIAAPAANEEALVIDPEASRTKLQTFIIMLSLCASVFLA